LEISTSHLVEMSVDKMSLYFTEQFLLAATKISEAMCEARWKLVRADCFEMVSRASFHSVEYEGFLPPIV